MAPKKVRDLGKCLSPWEDEIIADTNDILNLGNYISAICLRRMLKDANCDFAIFQSRASGLWFFNYQNDKRIPKLTSKKQAMNAVDKLLVKDGYELLSQEEWDRLVVLR